MPFLNNYRQFYSPYTDYMNGQEGTEMSFNAIVETNVFRLLKLSTALLAIFMVHPIMVLVIYQNKTLSMVMLPVVIEVSVMDVVVVVDAIEIPKMKSSSFVSHRVLNHQNSFLFSADANTDNNQEQQQEESGTTTTNNENNKSNKRRPRKQRQRNTDAGSGAEQQTDG